MNAIIIEEREEVEHRLAELGLTPEHLRDAILGGEYARASCTANDPSITPGFLAWARTVRALRDILVPTGWERSEAGGLSTVMSPDGEFSIAVSSGDEATGVAKLTPKTKYKKGPATVHAVTVNRQMALFPMSAPVEAAEATSPRVTWLLLLHRTVDEVRSELSLPNGVGDDGRVSEWSQRIILDIIDLDQMPAFGDDDDFGPSPEDIVVDVTRKVN